MFEKYDMLIPQGVIFNLKEIEEMKSREEKRIREMRRESSEHEEILIEREKKLNKRSKLYEF